MVAVAELPNDIEELKAMLVNQVRLVAEKARLAEEKESALRQMTIKLLWTEEKLRALERRYFGRKSEKADPQDDKQNRLFDEAEAHADEAAPAVTETVTVQS